MRPMSTDPESGTGPYAEAAALYYDAGWTGPLPLPYQRKANPPDGFTGRHPSPSRADVQAWIDGDEGRGNIAVRLPEHVIGIDVDAYHEGTTTFRALGESYGGLAPTWRSTSRDDGSAIYFYRVAPGLSWPGQLGAGIEVIQHHHRYAVVWPSIHPSGNPYRWYDPDGLPSMVPPDPDLLPMLSPDWVTGITGNREAGDPIAKADLAPGAALAWLTTNCAPGTMCRRTGYALSTALADLAAPGSVHESARGAVLRLVSLAGEHHAGVSDAITRLGHAFVEAVTAPRDRVRTGEEAHAEWFGLVMGAVQIAAAKPANPHLVDPCDNPFAGIMAPDRTRLVTTPAPQVAWDYVSYVNDATPAVTATLTNVTELPAPERSTWAPIDLDGAWDGDEDDGEQPSILVRGDGTALLYRGQLNGLIGEAESGKTWVAFEAMRQVLDEGGLVQLYDFEDSRSGAISRLKALSVARDQVRDRLRYINPDEPVMGAASPQAWSDLAANLDERPDLIIVDGYNAAMGSQGLDMDKNGDVTAFAGLLRKMAACGAAVVTVDHVPKNPDGRLKGGIGAQAKRASVTGVTIRVEIDGDAYPAPGKVGYLRLSVDKDRRGRVRESAAGNHLAMCVIASDATTRKVSITLSPPDPNAVPAARVTKGRVTPELCERITAALQPLVAGASVSHIRDKMKLGNKDNVGACTAWLVDREFLVPSGQITGVGTPTYVVAKLYDAAAQSQAERMDAIRLPVQLPLSAIDEEDDYDDDA